MDGLSFYSQRDVKSPNGMGNYQAGAQLPLEKSSYLFTGLFSLITSRFDL